MPELKLSNMTNFYTYSPEWVRSSREMINTPRPAVCSLLLTKMCKYLLLTVVVFMKKIKSCQYCVSIPSGADKTSTPSRNIGRQLVNKTDRRGSDRIFEEHISLCTYHRFFQCQRLSRRIIPQCSPRPSSYYLSFNTHTRKALDKFTRAPTNYDQTATSVSEEEEYQIKM